MFAAEELVIIPEPDMEPTDSEKPFRSNIAPDEMVKSELSEMVPAAPNFMIPSKIAILLIPAIPVPAKVSLPVPSFEMFIALEDEQKITKSPGPLKFKLGVPVVPLYIEPEVPKVNVPEYEFIKAFMSKLILPAQELFPFMFFNSPA